MASSVKEIFKRRDLIRNLVMRQLKLRYKSSSLGFLWSLFNPLIMALVYWLVFSSILKGWRGAGIENYAAYLVSGLFAWNFFAGSISDSANCFVGNVSLVKKVYFPRMILPVSTVLTNLVNFLISLVVVFILLAVWRRPLGLSLLMLPWLMFVEFIIALGLSFFLCCLNVLFRDIEHMLQIILFAGFFLTPVIYPYSWVLDMKIQPLIYFLNPMACLTVLYQNVLYEGRFLPPQELLGIPPLALVYIPVIFSLLILFSGYFFLKKSEGMVIDHL